MALQISYEDRFGVIHPTAYARVIDVSLHIGVMKATAEVGIYHDQNARMNGKECLECRTYIWSGSEYTAYFSPSNLDGQGQTVEKSVYDVVKVLPEWSGSTDV